MCCRKEERAAEQEEVEMMWASCFFSLIVRDSSVQHQKTRRTLPFSLRSETPVKPHELQQELHPTRQQPRDLFWAGGITLPPETLSQNHHHETGSTTGPDGSELRHRLGQNEC